MKKIPANFDLSDLAAPAGPNRDVAYPDWISYGQSVGADSAWYLSIFGVRPVFCLEYVPFMMLDERISLGMKVIKGKIQSKNLLRVRTQNSELGQYVTDWIDRIWQTQILDDLLSFLDFGFSPVDCEFEKDEAGRPLPYDSHLYNPYYVRAAIRDETEFVGAYPRPGDEHQYIGFPKLLWITHNRRKDLIYGDSYYREAFSPFWEKWNKHGYLEGRRVWFQRCAFFGPVLKFPPTGVVTIGADGQKISAMQYASIVLNKLHTGASIAFPNEKDDDGKDLWEFIAAATNDVPTSYKEYGERLGIEIWEALGITNGLLETGANVFDESGTTDLRMQTFLSGLTRLYKEIAYGLRTSSLDYCVRKYFGPDQKYDIYVEDWDKVSAEAVQNDQNASNANQILNGGESDVPLDANANPTGNMPEPEKAVAA